MLPLWLLPLKLNLQGNTGYPDRMILFIWPFIAFIEFKAPGRPLTGERNQNDRINELKDRGYPCLITDNAEDAYAFLEAVALSATGRSLNDLSGLRGASIAPRAGEDNDFLRSDQNTFGKEIDTGGASRSPVASGLQRLAPTEERLGGVQGPESDRPPWEE